MPGLTETALARFDQGYNCSQSVFSAFAPQFGVPDELALKLASPFGGGMARQGHICGAVSGALMALGAGRGADLPAGKEEIYRLGQELLQSFESRHGTLLCRELIGYDLRTPDGWMQARQKGVFTTICPGLVRDAVEIAQALLKP
ncbi:MAG: C-GCAxxG-C-C family protein [Anaerolineales bacterium]|jgi:C_GCAxxG_C_C family probable redox protein